MYIPQQQKALSIEKPVWGYNRDEYMRAVNALTYWNYGGISYPYNAPDPHQSSRINPRLWNRSVSVVNAISGNTFLWGEIPELADVPVAGMPNQTSPQYVAVPALRLPVAPTKPIAKRVSVLNIPLSYGKPVNQSHNPVPVYQVPTAQISSIKSQARTGSRFMQWLAKAIEKVQNE